MSHKRHQYVISAGEVRLDMCCSLCGIPFEDFWTENPEWLKKIKLLVQLDPGSVSALPGCLWNGADHGEVDYWIWRASHELLGPRAAAPLHDACLLTIKRILQRKYSGQDPTICHITSLKDAFVIFIERANETRMRRGNIVTRTFEPSNYGNVYKDSGAISGWNRYTYVESELSEEDCWWKWDPLQLSLPHDSGTCPEPDWISSIPPEIAEIIFKYAYSQPHPLSRGCDYVFPQSWWRDILPTFDWLKDVKLDTSYVRDWERLIRELSAIDQGPVSPALYGFRNRQRIWKLACDMKPGDTFDLRTRYCSCTKNGSWCEVWLNQGPKWCRGSWDDVRREDQLPADWTPLLQDY